MADLPVFVPQLLVQPLVEVDLEFLKSASQIVDGMTAGCGHC